MENMKMPNEDVFKGWDEVHGWDDTPKTTTGVVQGTEYVFTVGSASVVGLQGINGAQGVNAPTRELILIDENGNTTFPGRVSSVVSNEERQLILRHALKLRYSNPFVRIWYSMLYSFEDIYYRWRKQVWV